MELSAILETIRELGWSIFSPKRVRNALSRHAYFQRGKDFAARATLTDIVDTTVADADTGDLRRFFDDRHNGPGVWKWIHYFDIYERHLGRFRGNRPIVLEIGVYSGGSLDMWHNYFGAGAQIIGVDIEPGCKAYERPGVTILIGDQQDRRFWREVKTKYPRLDVVIDDGGHRARQQVVTAEELLPHMAPGGVFICEDVVSANAGFAAFAAGLADSLNAFGPNGSESLDDPERRIVLPTTEFQAHIRSVCNYPFVSVIEMNSRRIDEMRCPKRGSSWEPFLQ